MDISPNCPIGCLSLILPTLQKYIELRRRLAGKSHTHDTLHPPEDIGDTISTPTKPFATTRPSVKVKLESRDMAQQIALLAEELLRASQEKVNISQANCDSVFLLMNHSTTDSHPFGTL